MKDSEFSNLDKPILKAKKASCLSVTVQYVFKANFNDTYYLDNRIIGIDELDKTRLMWFDPFLGKSCHNDITVAIAYVSDKKLVVLEKQNGEIKKSESAVFPECIVCEDHDEAKLLAAHITLKYQ